MKYWKLYGKMMFILNLITNFGIGFANQFKNYNVMEDKPKEEVMDIQQEFKELNAYFNDLYHHGVNQVKDAGQLWIEFTDKFNAFKRKLLSQPQPLQVSVEKP